MCPAPLHTARNYFLEEPITCVFKCTILAPRKHTTKPFSILQSWKTVIHRFLWSAELSIHVFRGQEIYKCLFGSWSISLSSGHYFPVLDNKIQDIGKTRQTNVVILNRVFTLPGSFSKSICRNRGSNPGMGLNDKIRLKPVEINAWKKKEQEDRVAIFCEKTWKKDETHTYNFRVSFPEGTYEFGLALVEGPIPKSRVPNLKLNPDENIRKHILLLFWLSIFFSNLCQLFFNPNGENTQATMSRKKAKFLWTVCCSISVSSKDTAKTN